MADFDTYETARNWLIGALLGAVGFLVGQVRKGDISRLEDRISRLEQDLKDLRTRLEDHHR